METGQKSSSVSRREFIKTSASSLAALGVAGAAHAAGSDTVRVGLIGCGGQGTRDIISCVNSSPGVEIVAMGDLFEDRLKESLAKLKKDVPAAVKVTSDKCFVGFDAFERVLACDLHMVLLTAPPAWRAQHFRAAVEAGKHVFMEKPGGVDPKQIKKGFKVEMGVQCETCHGPGEDHMKARFAAAASDDPNAAVEPGEIISTPTEEVCVKCHNSESPTFKAFCFNNMMQKIAHPNPKKPKEAAAVDCKSCHDPIPAEK